MVDGDIVAVVAHKEERVGLFAGSMAGEHILRQQIEASLWVRRGGHSQESQLGRNKNILQKALFAWIVHLRTQKQ